MTAHLHDVLIIGAGPGGSTAAALLAREGHDVLVVDKAEFPRFCIGESLLPGCLPVLERLGVEPDESSHVFKRGAEFVCETTGRSQVFDFSDGLDGCPPHAWHVDRSTFDQRLAERAVEEGATLRHGLKVVGIDIQAERVVLTARTDAGERRELSARYLIDASGQARVLARHRKTVQPIDLFGTAAAYAHFSDIGDDAWNEIGPHFDVRIIIVPSGWAWVIPLPGRRLSVGIVTRESGVEVSRIDAFLAASPLLQRWTIGARRESSRLAVNFSFVNREPFGARFGCVGDAAGFLDPVFSSGVTLAMRGAEALADRLHAALVDGSEAEPALMTPVHEQSRLGFRTFREVVRRFYHTRFIEHFLFGAPDGGDLRRGVVSVLAGDVWRQDNPFQEMLLRSAARVESGRRRTMEAA